MKPHEPSGTKTMMPKIQAGNFGLFVKAADTEDNLTGIWKTIKIC